MRFPFLLQKKGEGMSNLRTNYKDDVFTGKRKYNEIDNGDGSISFDDVTNYSQNGDTYGAAQINEVNDIINNLDNNSYRQTDGAETAIADNDYFPFFDASANAKKKTLWSNLKSILTQVFAIKVHNSNSAGTYGAGNASYFGHVKLSDNYTTSAGAASASVGASSQAVNSTYNKFKSQLTANNKEFYFDYKNGKYGYNTSADRGADTFHFFSSYEIEETPILNETWGDIGEHTFSFSAKAQSYYLITVGGACSDGHAYFRSMTGVTSTLMSILGTLFSGFMNTYIVYTQNASTVNITTYVNPEASNRGIGCTVVKFK